MAKTMAKTGATTNEQVHRCRCGGEVKMHTTFAEGRVVHYARCEACDAMARRPRDLKGGR